MRPPRASAGGHGRYFPSPRFVLWLFREFRHLPVRPAPQYFSAPRPAARGRPQGACTRRGGRERRRARMRSHGIVGCAALPVQWRIGQEPILLFECTRATVHHDCPLLFPTVPAYAPRTARGLAAVACWSCSLLPEFAQLVRAQMVGLDVFAYGFGGPARSPERISRLYEF